MARFLFLALSVSLLPLAFSDDMPSSPPSSLLFSSNPSLDCDPSDNTPDVFTSTFLSNGNFSFGCLSNGLHLGYSIAVAFSLRNFRSVPIWIANRSGPVHANASVTVDANGNVIARQVDNTVMWNSHTVGVVGLRLTEEGNLIMFNAQNQSVWESFDEPLNLLVPGQTLKPGSALVSRSMNLKYTAEMIPGGLVLYVQHENDSPLPYFVLAYPLRICNLTTLLASPCNETRFVLNFSNFSLSQANLSLQCRQTLAETNPQSTINFGSDVEFVRLDPDGNIRGYRSDFGSESFDLFEASGRGTCGFPAACPRFSICDNSTVPVTCRCPLNQSLIVSSQSRGAITIPDGFGCTPSPWNGEEPMDFFDLDSVDYFSNDFTNATEWVDTFDKCKQSCRADPTCQAAFYRNNTRECFLYEDLLSMIKVSNSNYSASLKVQPVDPPSLNRTSETKLIIGISVASIASVAFFIVWHFRRRRSATGQARFGEEELLAALPGQPKRFTFRELRRATAEFSQKLGGGGFGSVYAGRFGDGSKVAVKQLETARSTQGLKEYRAEVIALSNINHQNLVHLRGFCAEGPHRLLVYEFVPNGSLDKWLFHTPSNSPPHILDWKTRLTIAIHTARGLSFLHEQCRHRIVHLDIKPQNILLDENFVAKLSDFGLARLINEDQSAAITRMKGTPGYMAPECLIVTDATEKSDVYSFGMVLLEIVSGRKNVDVSRLTVHNDTEGWYFPSLAARKYMEGKVDELVDGSLMLGDNERIEAQRAIETAFWCIQDDAACRPAMGRVGLMLEGYAPVSRPPLAFHFGSRLLSRSNFSSTTSISPSDLPPDDEIERSPRGTDIQSDDEEEQQQQQP